MNGTPTGGQASPGDGGGPPKSRLESLTDSLDRLNKLVKWQYVLVGAILFLIGIAVLTDNAVVRRLTDPPFARGLITFIISVATIGLAFVQHFRSFWAAWRTIAGYEAIQMIRKGQSVRSADLCGHG